MQVPVVPPRMIKRLLVRVINEGITSSHSVHETIESIPLLGYELSFEDIEHTLLTPGTSSQSVKHDATFELIGLLLLSQ